MNWYKRKLVMAGGITSRIGPGPKGGEVFYAGGYGTFPIKDQLKLLKFWWDQNSKSWYRPVRDLMSDTAAQQKLLALGVPLDPIYQAIGGKPVATVDIPQQQNPTQQQRPQAQNIQTENSLSNEKRKWVLAKVKNITSLTPDTPVVVSKNSQGAWEWMTYTGEVGQIQGNVPDAVTSIRDGNNAPYTSENPKELFEKFSALFNWKPPVKEEANKPNVSNVPQSDEEIKAKSRIPRERISEHQQAVENQFLKTSNDIMMNALAGSGKTTMLRDLASYKPAGERWLYLVFNKKNQLEAQKGKPEIDKKTGEVVYKGKFPSDVEVLTSHAFLGRVLGTSAKNQLIPSTDLMPGNNESRLRKICDEIFQGEYSFEKKRWFAAKLLTAKIAEKAKNYAVNPSAPDVEQKIDELIRKFAFDTRLTSEDEENKGIVPERDYKPEITRKTIELLTRCLPGQSKMNQYEGLRDHDDTLWYSALMADKIVWPKYDVVLADECQDFNVCQILMLKKLKEKGARIVSVGDPNQAIYMFRGGDSTAFAKIQEMIGASGGSTNDLPVNYRSGTEIIDYVNKKTVVKNLQAGRKDKDGNLIKGLVTEGRSYEKSVDEVVQEYRANNGKFKQSTAFICRNNAPLVQAALGFMKSNIDFVMLGRDFSKELVDQIKRVTGTGAKAITIPINQFADKLTGYVQEITQKWSGRVAKAEKLKEVKSSTEALMAILEYLEGMDWHDPKVNMRVHSTVDLVDYLKARFSGVNTDPGNEKQAEELQKLALRDDKTYVTLTSAHRSKGMEYDRVFIVENDLFGGSQAKTPEEKQQEEHARYVAYTRAMLELHVLAPKEKGGEVKDVDNRSTPLEPDAKSPDAPQDSIFVEETPEPEDERMPPIDKTMV